MKKLIILGLPVLAMLGMVSCKDDQDPKIDTTKDVEFKLNVPPYANQMLELSLGGTVSFTVSQPTYGLTVVPTYGLEISLTPDFTPIVTEPVVDNTGEEHVVPGTYKLNLDSQLAGVLVAQMSDIANGINELLGIYDEDAYVEAFGEDGAPLISPLYVKASAYLGSGQAAISTATESNVITLAQVEGYAAFGSNELLLSVPGDANGWNHLPQVLYVGDTEDGSAMKFKGFAVVDGSFKVTDGDWEGSGNWGATEDGLEFDKATGTYTGKLIQNSQTNFSGLDAGLYYFYVELTDMTNGNDNAEVGSMTITPITAITLPGDYNGWDVNSNPLTQDDDFFTWTGSYSVTDAGWKFAMNNSWDINLGGSLDNLEFDGGNLFVGGSSITLDLEQYPWTATVQ
ncbi:MAG: hypothetical protein J1F12_01215 [Muribaculaceae bacterium]|nr:hypothetical protein [Muribaculaceae bacterium]